MYWVLSKIFDLIKFIFRVVLYAIVVGIVSVAYIVTLNAFIVVTDYFLNFVFFSVSFVFIGGNIAILMYDLLRLVSYALLSIFISFKVLVFTIILGFEKLLGLLSSRQLLFPITLSIIYIIACFETFALRFLLPPSEHFKNSILKYFKFTYYCMFRRNIFSLEGFPFAYFTRMTNKFFKLKTIDTVIELNTYHLNFNDWVRQYFFMDKRSSKRQIKSIQMLYEIFDSILFRFRSFISWAYRMLNEMKEFNYVMPIIMLFFNWYILFFGIDDKDPENYFTRGILGVVLDLANNALQGVVLLVIDVLSVIPFVLYSTDALVFFDKKHCMKSCDQTGVYIQGGKPLRSYGQRALNELGASMFKNNTEPLDKGAFFSVPTTGVAYV